VRRLPGIQRHQPREQSRADSVRFGNGEFKVRDVRLRASERRDVGRHPLDGYRLRVRTLTGRSTVCRRTGVGLLSGRVRQRDRMRSVNVTAGVIAAKSRRL
jgi:hypothetical protein